MTEQHLLLALQKTQQSHLFYRTLSSQSSQDATFLTLAQNDQLQIDAITYWIQQLAAQAAPLPYTPLRFGSHVTENLEIALSQEYHKIDFYSQILGTETHMEVRDLFYRLQAISYNQNLPLLRQALFVAYQNASSGAQQPTYNILNDIEKGKEFLFQAEGIVNELKSGTLDQEKLSGFLNDINYSLLGGVVLGGISAMILNEFLTNKDKE